MPIYQPGQAVDAIPSPALEGQVESSHVAAIALASGIEEVQTVTAPAGSGASQGDYFVITDSESQTYAVWLDIDADGTAPTGAAYVAADFTIEVDITSSDTDAVVATAIKDTLEADNDWIASGIVVTKADEVVTLTHPYPGNIAAPDIHNTGDTGDGSIVVATETAGVSPNLNSKYFLLSSSSTDYYVWFNVNNAGSDPNVSSRTGAEVALNGDESVAGIATAAAAVIDALSGLSSSGDQGVILVSSDTKADVLNASAGDSGFSVEIRAQGIADSGYGPAASPGSLTNTPSAFTKPT